MDSGFIAAHAGDSSISRDKGAGCSRTCDVYTYIQSRIDRYIERAFGRAARCSVCPLPSLVRRREGRSRSSRRVLVAEVSENGGWRERRVLVIGNALRGCREWL